MRIGMVCPYSMDDPGGVQAHAIELSEQLIRRGHIVSLLAPASLKTHVPDFVVRAGRSIPIPYNGSVARLSFTASAFHAVRRWLNTHEFDLVHIHEPNAPSVSMIALKMAKIPVVATYHASADRSRVLETFIPVLTPMLERVRAGIAVSEMARRWQVEQLGGDPILIPNGVDTKFFSSVDPWSGADDVISRLDPDRPRVIFLGRFDEPRKGLDVLIEAMPRISRAIPGIEVVVVGTGDAKALSRRVAHVRDSITILGRLSNSDKARAFKASDIYVAPHLGGESFGIVLVEAMAAGAAVVASDIPAFRAVCDDGDAGWLFPPGDTDALVAAVTELFSDKDKRQELAHKGFERSQRFDWSHVTTEVERVYETVLGPQGERNFSS
ncbi:glycosyltransferase family 4 protein [uncultured Corynebacterium sp.]|uniref:glycosyltransferase family 4 protein n=1 Tax=uncultured Corynebacterium sp. TaxID=159447 RepID=UPI0025D06862|nr:glycosyltransferase family 4 protein [uncultured Corynebacterium sp.]